MNKEGLSTRTQKTSLSKLQTKNFLYMHVRVCYARYMLYMHLYYENTRSGQETEILHRHSHMLCMVYVEYVCGRVTSENKAT